jgi:hypothetical protein
MTARESFYECWVNADHFLLGRKLAPLCLRHLVFLHAIQSPLVLTDLPLSIQDLEIAAVICSTDEGEELAALDAKKLSWLQRASRWVWHRRNAKCDLAAAVQSFIAYQDDYLALPSMGTKPSKGKIASCPFDFLLMQAAGLILKTGWSEKEVFNLPVGKMVSLNLAFGYLETGETTVISEQESQAMEQLKDLQALYAAERAKKGAK